MSVAGIQQVAARIEQIHTRFAALDGFADALTTAAPVTQPGSTAPHVDGDGPRMVAFGMPARSASDTGAPSGGAQPGWAAGLSRAGQALAPAIDAAAAKADVDPRLFAALVRAESNFDTTAVSHAGAIGPAQLMPGTAAGLGVDPHDPIQNLEGGARYLREQLDRFGSVELALAAYNAGPGRVAQAGGIPRIAETQAYVGRVMSYYRDLQ